MEWTELTTARVSSHILHTNNIVRTTLLVDGLAFFGGVVIVYLQKLAAWQPRSQVSWVSGSPFSAAVSCCSSWEIKCNVGGSTITLFICYYWSGENKLWLTKKIVFQSNLFIVCIHAYVHLWPLTIGKLELQQINFHISHFVWIHGIKWLSALVMLVGKFHWICKLLWPVMSLFCCIN